MASKFGDRGAYASSCTWWWWSRWCACSFTAWWTLCQKQVKWWLVNNVPYWTKRKMELQQRNLVNNFDVLEAVAFPHIHVHVVINILKLWLQKCSFKCCFTCYSACPWSSAINFWSCKGCHARILEPFLGKLGYCQLKGGNKSLFPVKKITLVLMKICKYNQSIVHVSIRVDLLFLIFF